MSRVVVVGSLNMDMVMRVPRIPRPGETVHGGRLGRYPGGKGANQAVAAARAGAAVAMVGAVGRDDAGNALLASLAEAGVDGSDVCQTADAATGTAMIVVDGSGANAIALAEGANLAVRPEDAARAVAAHDPAVVVVQREVPESAVHAALRHAPEGAIRVMNASPLEPGAELPLDVVDSAHRERDRGVGPVGNSRHEHERRRRRPRPGCRRWARMRDHAGRRRPSGAG